MHNQHLALEEVPEISAIQVNVTAMQILRDKKKNNPKIICLIWLGIPLKKILFD